MPKRDPVQEQMEALGAVRRDPESPASQALLIRALASTHSFLAAKAARIIQEMSIPGYGPALAAAFDRWMESTDRGCEAKTEIVRALVQTEWQDPAVFLRGIRHVQMEGSFGPPQDTAAVLRASSALGLAGARYTEAAECAVELLADPEPAARAGAIRALHAAATPGATLALRLKARLGDEAGEVMRECFQAIAAMEPRNGLAFVGGFLDSPHAEEAAFALAETRREPAFELIKSKLERTRPGDLRRALWLAIATMRLTEAEHYLRAKSEGGDTEAREALRRIRE